MTTLRPTAVASRHAMRELRLTEPADNTTQARPIKITLLSGILVG